MVNVKLTRPLIGPVRFDHRSLPNVRFGSKSGGKFGWEAAICLPRQCGRRIRFFRVVEAQERGPLAAESCAQQSALQR